MTPQQHSQCSKIIHSAAAGAAAGNLVPIPGVGIAADVSALVAMTLALSSVFNGNIGEEAAKGLAIMALKETMLKQPIKTFGKELSKLIPGLGQIVAPAVTAALIEAAGWKIAKDLASKNR